MHEYFPTMDIEVLHEKVNKFYSKYMINRHKVEILPPTVFLNNDSCDPSRYDLRPYLYTKDLTLQQGRIELHKKAITDAQKKIKKK